MGQTNRHLHSTLGCSSERGREKIKTLRSLFFSLFFSLPVARSKRSAAEFNFQTFLHSCFIQMEPSCRIRMPPLSSSLSPRLFLPPSPHCLLQPILWIMNPSVAGVFTSPTLLVLCCRSGLPSCCYSSTRSRLFFFLLANLHTRQTHPPPPPPLVSALVRMVRAGLNKMLPHP